MRGPRAKNELRLFRDEVDEKFLRSAVDEVVQVDKWNKEQIERSRPRKESSLDEFLMAFELVQPSRGCPEYSRVNTTGTQLSPVLDGHETMRKRRANLVKELEEAEPEQPDYFMLTPLWSDSSHS